MKVTFIFIAALSLLGCGSDPSSSSEIDEAAAKQRASALLPGGTPGAAHRIDTADEHRWSIDVAMTNGASVVVELERSDGAVAELTGDEAPFDYDFPGPTPGVLSFSGGKEKALAQKDGGVEQWELNLGSTQYEFYVRDTAKLLWEIKLDAKTGDVASVEQKDHAD